MEEKMVIFELLFAVIMWGAVGVIALFPIMCLIDGLKEK